MLSFEPYVLIVHILSFELFLFPRMLCRRDVMSTIIPHSIRYAQNASGSQEMLQSYLLEKQRDKQPDVFHTQNRLAMWDVEAGASLFEYLKHYGLFNMLVFLLYAKMSLSRRPSLLIWEFQMHGYTIRTDTTSAIGEGR